ncbi:MAG: DNA repair protein RecN [Clostridia bacterium]|nr:DNA repair protein RecN [Clostridia bacterium]
MLERLHIENLAVIESADLDLASGFSVLTGETGAGKSVLIHSLNLLLGERVSKDIVRSGCPKATVSGLFTGLSEKTIGLLREQGFESEGEVLLQRDLTADGKSSVRINGRPATVSMLREFAGNLVNIHGQHDNRALLDPATHVIYLDSFAKNDSVRSRYESVFSELKQVLRKISQINTDEQTRMQKIDLLTYQINEINSADLKPGEEERLSNLRTVLANAEKIEASLASAYALCSGEDNAREKLKSACVDLENVAAFDPRLSELSQRMTSLSDQLDDLSADLRDFLESQSFDPTELNVVEERLDLIYRLKRKYGASVEEILAFRDNAAAELDSINTSAEQLNDLNSEKSQLYEELKSAAAALTESRKRAGETLATILAQQLAFLDMPNTGFFVKIEPAGTFTPKGADTVEFLLSANLGEDLRPLSKIASGGELSRIMLSMKTCLTLEEDAETLIFDEIDTGVSGKAAEKIAIKLKEISKGKQVIVVTHLAQIAAYGDEHFLIQKSVSDDRTFTTVTPLDRVGRIGELARIIGGISPTDATLAAAEDLLSVGSQSIQ